MKNKYKSTAFLGISTALALVLAYVELLIQPLFPSFPGIKMGLPNIIIIFLLYKKNAASAISVSLVRIFLASLLFGNTMALIYSLAGGVLSIVVMMALKKLNLFSPLGVSVAGAVSHNVGQILTAMLLLETVKLGYYLVVLIMTGTIAGIMIGLCGALLVRKIPDKLFL